MHKKTEKPKYQSSQFFKTKVYLGRRFLKPATPKSAKENKLKIAGSLTST